MAASLGPPADRLHRGPARERAGAGQTKFVTLKVYANPTEQSGDFDSQEKHVDMFSVAIAYILW